MTQEEQLLLDRVKIEYKIGTIFCTPSTCWDSYPKGDYKVLGAWVVEDRGVYCATDKGNVWIFFRKEWGVIKKSPEELQKLELKGRYRERIKELTDENIRLKYENEELKRKLANI